MKTSLKKFTSLVLAVMMLISVMTAAGISVSAATTDDAATGADTVYLDLSAVTAGDETFFAWKWGSVTDAFYSLEYDSASGYYTTTMSAGDGLVLVRMPAGSTTGNWDTKYNQSEDFDYDGTNNLAVFSFSSEYGGKMPVSVSKYSGGQVVPTETTQPPTVQPPTVPTAKPTDPTEPSEETDPDELQNLYVVATSNLGERALVKTEGTKTSVTYSLTAAELIDGGAFTVTYDTSKLTLDSGYTSAQMFPVVSDATYNLSAGTGEIMVNFTNAADKYDFTNGAVLVTLVFNEKEGKTGRAAVNLEVTDLYSANTTYALDGAVYDDSAVVTAAVADTSAEPGEKPEDPVVTDPNTNVTVRAYSNINSEIKEYNVTGSYIKVTYNLTAAELIAFGNGTVSFDENVLALESIYNAQNTMFTTISDYVTYNLAVAPGVMEFAFSGINSNTQTGLYDFRNEAQLITLYFTVKAGATGSTAVKLDMENLGSTGKDYIADYGVAAGVSSSVVAEATGTPSTVPTTPQPTTPQPTTPQPTTPQPTTPQPTTPQPTTPQPTTPQPTTPQPTTPQPTTPKPTTPAKTPYLNKTSETVKAGATFNIKVMDNVTGATAKFSVSNPDVLKVSKKGKVTACSKGTAYIYATVGSEVLSCKVKVTTNPKLTNTNGKKIKKVTIGVGGKATKILISGKAAKLKNQYKSTAYVKVTGGKQKPFIKIKGLKAGKSTLEIKVNRTKTLKLKVTVK